MKLPKENIEYVLSEFFRLISHIADLKYQRRVWIKGKGPECDSFTETVCSFFDFWDIILENCKEFGITENQNKILKEFHDAFDSFCDKNDYPEEFIESSEWKKIMGIAKGVLNAFNYKKN